MEDLITKLFEKIEIAITFSAISFCISIMLFLGLMGYLMIKEGKDE